jgi:Pentapeptide repeats (8 copies)
MSESNQVERVQSASELLRRHVEGEWEFRSADLRGADLWRANLQETHLCGAKFNILTQFGFNLEKYTVVFATPFQIAKFQEEHNLKFAEYMMENHPNIPIINQEFDTTKCAWEYLIEELRSLKYTWKVLEFISSEQVQNECKDMNLLYDYARYCPIFIT